MRFGANDQQLNSQVIPRQPWRGVFIWSVALLLAAIPALRALDHLANTGMDVLTNDYLFTIQVVDQLLSGKIGLVAYFQQTFNSHLHSTALMTLIHWVNAAWFDYSHTAELLLSWLLAILKLCLLYLLLTRPVSSVWKPLFLPLLSLLVMGLPQLALFSFGEAGIQINLIQVGILVNLWLPLRTLPITGKVIPASSVSLAAITAMGLAGIASSWVGLGGFIAWPLGLLALWYAGERRWYGLGLYLIFAGLALAPYALAPGTAFGAGWLAQHALEVWPMVLATAIGFPVSNGIGAAGLSVHPEAAWIGLLLFVVGLPGLIWLGWGVRRHPAMFFPTLLVFMWGWASTLQVVLTRALMAPWYTIYFLPQLLALCGLALLLLLNRPELPLGRPWGVLWGIAWLGVLTILGIRANLTIEDKIFNDTARSPVAVACQQSYATAPTFCESAVFQWHPGNPGYLADLAWPLQQHQLSVFAPQQVWTLQGAFITRAVQLTPADNWDIPRWVDASGKDHAWWGSYQHLDLLVPPGSQVEWAVDLPQDALRLEIISEMRSRIAGAPAVLDIGLMDEAGNLLADWQFSVDGDQRLPIALDVLPYAGQSAIIRLTAGGAPLLAFPRLEVELPRRESLAESDRPDVQPENTNLNPALPATSATSLRLPGLDDPGWQVAESTNGSLTYTQQIDACLGDVAYFYIQTALPEQYQRRTLFLMLTADDGQTYSTFMPLLADGGMHTYAYPFKLINLPLNTRLTGLSIRLDARLPGNLTVDEIPPVEWGEVFFIPAQRQGACGP